MTTLDNYLNRQRQTLLLAASDMDQAAAAAKALADESDDVDLMRALETALAICYARPFTSSDMGHLDRKKWAPPAPWDELHLSVLELRNQTYAHTLRASGRSAGPSVDIQAMPGVSEVVWSEGWWAFPREWIPHVLEMCRSQARRFRDDAQALIARTE